MTDSRRDALSRQLLDVPYAELPPVKQSVIDLMVDERPTAAGPRVKGEGDGYWERLADKVAAVGGSWRFIIGFGLFLIAWAVINAVVLTAHAFDPYPFIFLNLLLSMLAAVQAPVIMMSQNRQAEKDRLAAALDYEVNVKAETAIAELPDKIDRMQAQIEHLVLHAEPAKPDKPEVALNSA